MKKDAFVSEVRRLIGKDQEGSRIRESVTMSFLLGTIGDRLGVPMETMTRAQILEKNGGKEVTTYVDPREWRTCGPEWGVFTRPAEASDDTALMLCSMRAIRKGGGEYFVLHAAMELVNTVLHGTVQGWGGTVRSQAELIERYFLSLGREGRSPHHEFDGFGSGMGHGNGAALRAVPLMWAGYLRTESRYGAPTAKEYLAQERGSDPMRIDRLYRWYVGMGRRPNWLQTLHEELILDAIMTHSDHRYAVRASEHLFGVLDALPVYAVHESPRIPVGPSLQMTAPTHGSPEVVPYINDRASEALPPDLHRVHLFRTCPIERLVTEIGTGGDAAESVPLAMWVAIRHADDPRAALIEAINTGGDTDSVAFLVGQLVGFHSTLDQLPEEWIEGDVGEELFALVRDELVPFLDCYPRTVQENE